MIHILTIHHENIRWIDFQFKNIKKYIKREHRIYMWNATIFHDNIHPDLVWTEADINRYFYVFDSTNTDDSVIRNDVSRRFDVMLEKVYEDCDENDILIFLDNDAVFLDTIDEFLFTKLKNEKYDAVGYWRAPSTLYDPTIAIDNSFFATTVGYWKKIKGNWDGISGVGDKQFGSDYGAVLTEFMMDKKTNFYEMKNTNKITLHPRYYQIYENLVYHHGCTSTPYKVNPFIPLVAKDNDVFTHEMFRFQFELHIYLTDLFFSSPNLFLAYLRGHD
tara:strand:+ start:1013 stop:1837 length:825 start_codon:yes stop_codon:yes gene_type:complete